MAVIVPLPLFGHLGQELEQGTAVRSRQLRDLAEDLNGRLLRAADMLDRLAAEGWTAHVALYDLLLAHADAQTREEAIRRLTALGVDPEHLMIVEEVGEEDLGHA
jgi:hypothetical protein